MTYKAMLWPGLLLALVVAIPVADKFGAYGEPGSQLGSFAFGVWVPVLIATTIAFGKGSPMTKADALMVFDRLDEAQIECRIRARTVEYIDPDRPIGEPMTPDIVREYSVEVEAKAMNEPDLLHLVADQASKYDAAIEGDFAALVLR